MTQQVEAPPISIRTLAGWRLRGVANSARAAWRENRLKVVVVSVTATAFWAGLFALFHRGFAFTDRRLALGDGQEVLLNFSFSLFFLALLLMLVFSNAVICLGAMYRNDETTYLLSAPVPHDRLYLYKQMEAMLFSSWAFMALGLPLMLAFGIVHGVPWLFYIGMLLYAVPYIMLPASLGALLALLLMSFLPRLRRRMLALAVGTAVVFTGWVMLRLIGQGERFWHSGSEMNKLLHSLNLTFTQNPYLPSTWISRGLMAMRGGDWTTGMFYGGVLLSTTIFVLSLSTWLAVRLYPGAFDRAHSIGQRRARAAGRVLDLLPRLYPRSSPIALLLIKDLKTFLRDPVQWSQVVIFFGLLAIYIANLRRFPYDLNNVFFKNLISFLNLAATSMTLATLVTRFVFPLLSLEGQKFWVLGLLPVARRRILMGKFIFALTGSLLLTETLVLMSNHILTTGVDADRLLMLHVFSGALMCFGLSGLAVGMGALFPMFHESNPSKIVAGFGGTLTLVLATAYVIITILLLAVPCHWYFVTEQEGAKWVVLGGATLATLLSLGVGLVPLLLGMKAFDRMEF